MFFPLAHCVVSVLQSQKQGCTNKAPFCGTRIPLLHVSMVVLLPLYLSMGTKHTDYKKTINLNLIKRYFLIHIH